MLDVLEDLSKNPNSRMTMNESDWLMFVQDSDVQNEIGCVDVDYCHARGYVYITTSKFFDQKLYWTTDPKEVNVIISRVEFEDVV